MAAFIKYNHLKFIYKIVMLRLIGKNTVLPGLILLKSVRFASFFIG